MNNLEKPSAFIATRNNRLKAYSDVVYLKDGDEFQIELFNPLQKRVLAKIYLNGLAISDTGIVINPGQRYFLDRYIDVAKKFKFSTYQVDGTSEQVLKAIEKNGSVKIEFYNELELTYTTGNNIWGGISGNNTITTGIPTYQYYGVAYNNIDSGDLAPLQANFTSNTSNTANLETGRIEKGGKSNQIFSTTNSQFSYFPDSSISWKILPTSTKPIEVKEIRNYCSCCGTRIKKQSWKFCPNCGEAL